MNDRDAYDDVAGSPAGERLRSAIRVLRDAPPVRDAWRERLLDRVQAETPMELPSDVAARRRWSVHPAVALAACLACAILGGTVTYGALRAGRHSESMTPVVGTAGRSYPVRFTLEAPTARRVAIVGDFNQWNPASQPMRRSSDGRTWTVEVGLPIGTYAYAFVVDDRLALDPSAPQSSNDDFGMPNSIRLVSGK